MKRWTPILAVAIALTAFACPVRSETGTLDRKTCRASSDTSAIADCIEAGVYDPCDDAGGSWGNSQCAAAHSLVAQRRIDRALTVLRERVAAELEASELERLASSQRSFEQYRDEFCTFKGAADIGSHSLVGEMLGYCIRYMNQMRAKELENMLRAGPTIPLVVPGTTPEERALFLGRLPEADPRLRDYVQLGLTSQDARVREVAADRLPFPLWEQIPILLQLIATDPDKRVRLAAALNLNCRFTCNGAKYEPEDVLVLERDIPLLRAAITEPVAARYMSEILETVWCDMTGRGRAEVTSIIASVNLPEGAESDRAVKNLLDAIDRRGCETH